MSAPRIHPFALLVIAIASIAGAHGRLAAQETSVLQERARAAGQALLGGRYEAFADYCYPQLVAMLGGRDSMATTLRRELATMTEQGFSFRSFEAMAPRNFDTSGARVFALVPTSLVLGAPGGRLVVEGSMIAVSEDSGVTWTFIDASNNIEQALTMFFPEEKGLIGRLEIRKVASRFEPEKE